MNLAAANIFSKPWRSRRQHDAALADDAPLPLLPTIRSRVLHFRFHRLPRPSPRTVGRPGSKTIGVAGRLAEGVGSDKHVIADHIFTLYGLVARFNAVLDFATPSVEAAEGKTAAGPRRRGAGRHRNRNRQRSPGPALAEIERATGPSRCPGSPRRRAGRRSLVAAIESWSTMSRLLRLNLNEAAVLEDFLLGSLRICRGGREAPPLAAGPS